MPDRRAVDTIGLCDVEHGEDGEPATRFSTSSPFSSSSVTFLVL